MAQSGIEAIAKIAFGIFVLATAVGVLIAAIGLSIVAPAISLAIIYFVMIAYAVITIIDALYGVEDENYKDNKFFMSAMTFVPSIASLPGQLWLLIQALLFIGRIL